MRVRPNEESTAYHDRADAGSDARVGCYLPRLDAKIAPLSRVLAVADEVPLRSLPAVAVFCRVQVLRHLHRHRGGDGRLLGASGRVLAQAPSLRDDTSGDARGDRGVRRPDDRVTRRYLYQMEADPGVLDIRRPAARQPS